MNEKKSQAIQAVCGVAFFAGVGWVSGMTLSDAKALGIAMLGLVLAVILFNRVVGWLLSHTKHNRPTDRLDELAYLARHRISLLEANGVPKAQAEAEVSAIITAPLMQRCNSDPLKQNYLETRLELDQSPEAAKLRALMSNPATREDVTALMSEAWKERIEAVTS